MEIQSYEEHQEELYSFIASGVPNSILNKLLKKLQFCAAPPANMQDFAG
jgi:hypothetical protein